MNSVLSLDLIEINDAMVDWLIEFLSVQNALIECSAWPSVEFIFYFAKKKKLVLDSDTYSERAPSIVSYIYKIESTMLAFFN